MNKGMFIFAFSLGAAIGSFVTWRVLKEKYEKLAREELAERRERFANSEPSFKHSSEETEETVSSEQLKSFIDRYSSAAVKNNEKGDVENMRAPYTISPDQFGEIHQYNLVNLTYYEDGALVDDETDERIDDIENTVGEGFEQHFGVYEDDVVHVRNEELMVDYEIVFDHRNYSDVLRLNSHLPVDE